MERSEVDWLAEVRRLRDRIDEAYAEARAKVFDVEGPGADPNMRTPRQRRVVQRLAALEDEMRRLRSDWAADPRSAPAGAHLDADHAG